MIDVVPKKQEVYKNGNKQEMYFLQLDKVKTMEFDVMCDLMASRTTLSANEVAFVLGELADMVVENIKQGRGTNLGKLGYIVPTLSAQAKEADKELSLNDIKSLGLKFRASKQIREEIKYLKFNIKRPHAKQE